MNQKDYLVKGIGTLTIEEDYGSLIFKDFGTINIFGKSFNVRVIFDVDEDKLFKNDNIDFPNAIIALFDKIKMNISSVINIVEEETLDYYNEEIAGECDDEGIEFEHIEDIVKIGAFLDFDCIYFRELRNRIFMGFMFHCSWDEEHGYVVKFIDGVYSECGSQDIIL